MTFGPELRPRALSGSVDLQQPGSVLTSMASVTIEGHADG